MSLAETSAPYFSSSSTTASEPTVAAKCSGEAPARFPLAWMSAPCCISTCVEVVPNDPFCQQDKAKAERLE